MNVYQSWYYEQKARRTIEALIKNGLKACYASTAEEAKKIALEMVPEGSVIGVGGSLTLSEIGLMEALGTGKYHLLNSMGNMPYEAKTELRRKSLTSDYYFTGTNAITEDGKLVNIDGTGNRVASMIFGPGNVIVLAGVNKITANLEEALVRSKEGDECKEAEPQNTMCLYW
jgi:L-lactate utilization protein LutB